jgi:hypothetical protein
MISEDSIYFYLFLFLKELGSYPGLLFGLVYFGPVWHIIYPAKSQIKKNRNRNDLTGSWRAGCMECVTQRYSFCSQVKVKIDGVIIVQ